MSLNMSHAYLVVTVSFPLALRLTEKALQPPDLARLSQLRLQSSSACGHFVPTAVVRVMLPAQLRSWLASVKAADAEDNHFGPEQAPSTCAAASSDRGRGR
jgi:hypothetical protein